MTCWELHVIGCFMLKTSPVAADVIVVAVLSILCSQQSWSGHWLQPLLGLNVSSLKGLVTNNFKGLPTFQVATCGLGKMACVRSLDI